MNHKPRAEKFGIDSLDVSSWRDP